MKRDKTQSESVRELEREALPCPFCGGAARAHAPEDGNDMWSVGCGEAFGCVRPRNYGDSPRHMVEEWNRRADLEVPQVRDAIVRQRAEIIEALANELAAKLDRRVSELLPHVEVALRSAVQ
jgi:hypothetical protein